MDSEEPLPRKALFQKQRGISSKHSQILGDTSGYDKSEFMTGKAKLQFELDVELTHKSLDRDLHMQRLKNLRLLAEKLKDDAWMYPELESALGI